MFAGAAFGHDEGGFVLVQDGALRGGVVGVEGYGVLAERVEGGDVLVEGREDVEACFPEGLAVREGVRAAAEVLFLALVNDGDAVGHKDVGGDVLGKGEVGGVVCEAWHVLVLWDWLVLEAGPLALLGVNPMLTSLKVPRIVVSWQF